MFVNIKLKLKSLIIIFIFCLSSQNIVSANDSLSNNFLSFEDLAINGSKNYECGEYHLSWIAYLIIEENLKEIKFKDNLNDEQFDILQGLIRTAWEESDKSNIDCSNARTVVQNAFDRNQNLYKSEYIKDSVDFLKLKTSRSFFGVKLQDKASNYNFTYKKPWQGKFYERSLLMHEINPPMPNSIFENYTIHRYPDLYNSDMIEYIDASANYLSKKVALSYLDNIIDFYKNNTDSNFIAGVYDVNWKLSGYYLPYEKYKTYELNDKKETGFGVVIEIKNSNEQIILNTTDIGGNWYLSMNIQLVENQNKIANINQGL